MSEEQVRATAIVKKAAPSMSYELAAIKQIEGLTVEMAKADIWPDAPIAEVRKAVHIAKARGANPWCSEIYLIPRNSQQGKKWVTQMSQNYVLKVATGHPGCAGWQDGVIVQGPKGELDECAGAFVPHGWKLVGAWFKGYRKGWQVPLIKRVNLEEYSTGKSTWAKIPATMILKVARTQGLREMLPDRLSGMYDAAEMDQMGEVITPSLPQAQATEEPPPPWPAPTKEELALATKAAIEPVAEGEVMQPAAYEPQGVDQTEPEPPGEDKQARQIDELGGIIMVLAEGDTDAGKQILIDWSSFEGKRGGKPATISLDSLKSPSLKGKWLYRILAKAREEKDKTIKEDPAMAAAFGITQEENNDE